MFSNWNVDNKLRHVYFCLEDAARTWFGNRELALVTWRQFRSALLKTLTSVVRKAEAIFEPRAQLPNENIAMYTEEMTRLFRHADPDVSEDEKIHFLMGGVKQELFGGLIRNPPKTVAEFITEATGIEKTLEIRTRQDNRQVLSPKSEIQALASDEHRDTIRAVVREELRRMFPSSQPKVASTADIVHGEIQQSLAVTEA